MQGDPYREILAALTRARAANLAAVRRSQPEDYDGHTEFARLSPDARLRWLEAAVRFVQASKRVRQPPVGPDH